MLKKFVALPLLAAVGVGSSVGLASAAGTATSPTFKVCVNQAGVVFGATSKGRCPSGDRLLTIDPISLPGPGPKGRPGRRDVLAATVQTARRERLESVVKDRPDRRGLLVLQGRAAPLAPRAPSGLRGSAARWCSGLHDHQRPRLGELRWHLGPGRLHPHVHR